MAVDPAITSEAVFKSSAEAMDATLGDSERPQAPLPAGLNHSAFSAAAHSKLEPMPAISSVPEDSLVLLHLLEMELLLRAASSMSVSTPWVIGPEFQQTPTATIDGMRQSITDLRHGLPTLETMPDSYAESLPDPGTAILSTLFNWHCATFSPIHEHLNDLEREYIRAVFAAYAADQFNWAARDDAGGSPGFYKMSTFSFSYRVKGDSLNASRFALGLSGILPNKRVTDAARAVMLSKGATDALDLIDGHPDSIFFHGLGWDTEANAFRTYVVTEDITKLPPSITRCVPALAPQTDRPASWDPAVHAAYGFELSDIRQQSIISYAYARQKDGTFKQVEEKVYVYPTEEALGRVANLPEGIIDAAFMFSTDRGVVEQFDVEHADEYPYHPPGWRSRLSAIGQAVYDKYIDHGLTLDTITYKSPDDATLYFPM